MSSVNYYCPLPLAWLTQKGARYVTSISYIRMRSMCVCACACVCVSECAFVSMHLPIGDSLYTYIGGGYSVFQ